MLHVLSFRSSFEKTSALVNVNVWHMSHSPSILHYCTQFFLCFYKVNDDLRLFSASHRCCSERYIFAQSTLPKVHGCIQKPNVMMRARHISTVQPTIREKSDWISTTFDFHDLILGWESDAFYKHKTVLAELSL